MRPVRSKCGGQVIPLVAVMLFGFLVLAALAIDMGMLYTARTSGQHAADAAALAGAYTFLNPAAVQPAAAQQAAISVGGSNSILQMPVTIAAGDVAVDPPNRRVTVTVSRTGAAGIPTFFARIMGRSQVDLITTATAEASATGSGSRCVKPIFLPNTILSSASNVTTACNNNELIFDSSGKFTTFAQARLGMQVQIRPTDPMQALKPGQFYSLDFGSGGKDYRCALGKCLNECAGIEPEIVRCGDSYPIKTGNMVGPTNQGIDDLVGNPADTWVAIGQYQDASGQIWDSSRSLVIAPVWDNCSQVVSPGYAGQSIKIIGFASMFVDGTRGSQVYAHLAGETECGAAGTGSGGGAGGGSFGASTGPAARPVRLVNETP